MRELKPLYLPPMNRREFLATAGAGTALAGLPTTGRCGSPQRRRRSDREAWVRLLLRVANPVLTNLAAGTLKARMPVEQAAGATRQTVTHLEAIGRLLSGIAPWLELRGDETAEGRERTRCADLARRAISRAVDPASADFMNFTRERQPLVDAAFLAQGLLRAPRALRDELTRDPAQPHCRTRIDPRDRARLQQLAAVLGNGRGRA